jgi:hypothetical protein
MRKRVIWEQLTRVAFLFPSHARRWMSRYISTQLWRIFRESFFSYIFVLLYGSLPCFFFFFFFCFSFIFLKEASFFSLQDADASQPDGLTMAHETGVQVTTLFATADHGILFQDKVSIRFLGERMERQNPIFHIETVEDWQPDAHIYKQLGAVTSPPLMLCSFKS